MEDAFSTFPSNTLIANGALFTGRFPDGTAIKSQNQFERSTLKPRGQLSAWLPDGFMPKPTSRVLNLLDKYAPENTHQFMVDRHVPTLATRLGAAYRFTTLPIAPLNPPPQWFHVAVNTLGPISLATRLPTQLDRVNARYAIDQMLGDPYARVMAVWFPMVDKTSHHSPHGQFGAARRDLVLADKYVGLLLDRLHELRWDQSTYVILMSDHGHVGGNAGTNRAFNVPRDWAYRYLGCNAKVVGNEWVHPGMDPNHFIFFDNQGAGQAKIFLPYGTCTTGPWRRNRLYELTHYGLTANQHVDLLESLETAHPEGSDSSPSPVDLILVKLDERRILVRRGKENQAMIHRTGGSDQEERYRYEPVQQVEQTPDGDIHSVPAVANRDPLRYLQDRQFLSVVGSPAWIDQPHTADEWLLATRHTAYPDAVVAMTKFFAWREAFKDLAETRDPDVLMTASRGWSFRSDGEQGTDHGYPLAESMRITFVVSGPQVVHGVWSSPQRLIDVPPTILDMIQAPYQPSEIDGRPLDGIYQ